MADEDSAYGVFEDSADVAGPQVIEEDQSMGDRLLVPGRPLAPRHRKLAELAAQGIPNNKIATQLDYSDSRVSILLSNTEIKREVERIRERIYEDTIANRLKGMAEPALAELERCLADKTNKYKENLKVETAKWLVEKLDGKAIQKHDIGENLLGVMMDRLDALKSSAKTLDVIDITAEHRQITSTEVQEAPIPKTKDEEDLIRDWCLDFAVKK